MPALSFRIKLFLVVLAAFLILAGGVGYVTWYKLFHHVSTPYANDETYFKYGSIGTESKEGIPYWIWVVLPKLFPQYLPATKSYAAFGVIYEPGRDIPIGFSKQTVGFPRVGINCALCHTGTVRSNEHDSPAIYLGAPPTKFDSQAYLKFLFDCAGDPGFTPTRLLGEIRKRTKLSWIDTKLYRYLIIPQTRKALLKQRDSYAWMFDSVHNQARWGPGRIDPFNPPKFRILGIPPDSTIGNSDMLPVWNLQERQGKSLHWDGLQGSVHEVVLSSALGDGATQSSLPLGDLQRLETWLDGLAPPRFPFEPDPLQWPQAKTDLWKKGKEIYFGQKANCATCHDLAGSRTGTVVPIEEVGTDRHRLDMWTDEARARYGQQGNGSGGTFQNFRKTNGYVAVPLQGLWLRAPYLHNGSVPSLTALLEPPPNRPTVFYRGYDVYDPGVMGFVSAGPSAEAAGFKFDTAKPGNSNEGHWYGTQLTPDEKVALIEYLKSL